MPKEIIDQFRRTYGGKRGERIFYATAAKQGRSKETFEKRRRKLREAVQDVFGDRV